jgi:SAM-dependent methyltransferase
MVETMQTHAPLFDRPLLRRHRERAARRADPDALFLLHAALEDLLERLSGMRREFPVAVDLGAHGDALAEALDGRGGIRSLISIAPSPALAALCPRPVIVAEEDALPLADASADLVLSCLSLHWVDDLPGLFADVLRVLKPGGLFLAVMPGEETLRELRDSLARAELEVDGGISPRVLPMLTVKDGGALLQRAGFADPVVDRDRLTVDYADPLRLMADLRAMGETNALTERRKTPLKRTTLAAALATYAETYANDDGRVVATFDLVTLTAWKPETR